MDFPLVAIVLIVVIIILCAVLFTLHRCCCRGTNRDVEAQRQKRRPRPAPKTNGFTKIPQTYNWVEGEKSSEPLDLHGLTLKQALDEVPDFLLEKKKEYRRGGSHYCDIITGRGNHSRGGVPVLKPGVEKFLRKKGYSFKLKNPGMIRVDLSATA